MIGSKNVYIPNNTDKNDIHEHMILAIDVGMDSEKKYYLEKQLGVGASGKVFKAEKMPGNVYCAVKVIEGDSKYREAAKKESSILSTIKKSESFGASRCVHLQDTFNSPDHFCIVTDLYGQDIYSFMKSNKFLPFPRTQIQKLAKQLFTSVKFLHNLGIIHADLKPENIVLISSNKYLNFEYNLKVPCLFEGRRDAPAKVRKVLLDPEIRLIDFGSATFHEKRDQHEGLWTSEFCAPEIINDCSLDYACDIWSIGCILVELFTGTCLFDAYDNEEHLAMIDVICGTLVKPCVIRKAKGIWPLDIIELDNEFNKAFLDLLKNIFVKSPAERITAEQALEHRWFKESLRDDGTQAHDILLEKQKSARKFLDSDK